MILKICREDCLFTVAQSDNFYYQFPRDDKNRFDYWVNDVLHAVNLKNVIVIFLMNDQGDTIESLYRKTLKKKTDTDIENVTIHPGGHIKIQ